MFVNTGSKRAGEVQVTCSDSISIAYITFTLTFQQCGNNKSVKTVSSCFSNHFDQISCHTLITSTRPPHPFHVIYTYYIYIYIYYVFLKFTKYNCIYITLYKHCIWKSNEIQNPNSCVYMCSLYPYSLIVYNYDLYSSFITKVGTLQAFQCKIVTPFPKNTNTTNSFKQLILDSYWYFHRNSSSQSQPY